MSIWVHGPLGLVYADDVLILVTSVKQLGAMLNDHKNLPRCDRPESGKTEVPICQIA